MSAPDSQFVLRERKFWESTDLAILMFRRWIVALSLSFGISLGVIAGLSLWFLPQVATWLPILLIWWLKPLMERIILSQAGLLFFQPNASVQSLLNSLSRTLSLNLLWGLTWRRFSWFRAFLMPVDMFERPPKSQRKSRRTWVRAGLGGQLFGLSALFFTVELILTFSIYLGIYAIFSASMAGIPDNANPLSGYLTLSISYALAVLLVEPVYVLSTFAIYLNRRTLHEGWDLRLAFQNLSRTTTQPRKSLATLLVMTMLFGLTGLATPLSATANSGTPSPEASYAQKLNQVVENRDFGAIDHSKTLRFKSPQASSQPESSTALPNMGNLLSSQAVRLFAIGAGSTVCLFFMIFLFRRIPAFANRSRRTRVGSPEITARTLEEQYWIPTLAQGLAAWNRGDQRMALACLYQTGIAYAIKRYQVKLPASATEETCLRLLAQAQLDSDFNRLFQQLTQIWIQVSWSNQMVEAQDFQALYRNFQLLTAGESV